MTVMSCPCKSPGRKGRVSPVARRGEAAGTGGQRGVWVTKGEAAFGPDAVHAAPDTRRPGTFGSADCSNVPGLNALDPRWFASQFVRDGNPHCVTLLADAAHLPSNDICTSDRSTL